MYSLFPCTVTWPASSPLQCSSSVSGLSSSGLGFLNAFCYAP
ncbi:hypothetical protein NFI96_006317 [Prochilodus magdalenae]|nr:hypothetical protein NFI96_006317 [Prochilodus magdalenae]